MVRERRVGALALCLLLAKTYDQLGPVVGKVVAEGGAAQLLELALLARPVGVTVDQQLQVVAAALEPEIPPADVVEDDEVLLADVLHQVLYHLATEHEAVNAGAATEAVLITPQHQQIIAVSAIELAELGDSVGNQPIPAVTTPDAGVITHQLDLIVAMLRQQAVVVAEHNGNVIPLTQPDLVVMAYGHRKVLIRAGIDLVVVAGGDQIILASAPFHYPLFTEDEGLIVALAHEGAVDTAGQHGDIVTLPAKHHVLPSHHDASVLTGSAGEDVGGTGGIEDIVPATTPEVVVVAEVSPQILAVSPPVEVVVAKGDVHVAIPLQVTTVAQEVEGLLLHVEQIGRQVLLEVAGQRLELRLLVAVEQGRKQVGQAQGVETERLIL